MKEMVVPPHIALRASLSSN